MSDLNVDVNDIMAPTKMTINQEEVLKFLENVKKGLKMAKAFAAITPTDYDDKALEAVEKFIVMVEPVVTEPWFAKLADVLIHLVIKNDAPATQMALKQFADSL